MLLRCLFSHSTTPSVRNVMAQQGRPSDETGQQNKKECRTDRKRQILLSDDAIEWDVCRCGMHQRVCGQC